MIPVVLRQGMARCGMNRDSLANVCVVTAGALCACQLEGKQKGPEGIAAA